MHRIQVGKWEFRYIVGPYTVGIITPTRQKHMVGIGQICDPKNRFGLELSIPGTPDDRVTPSEVARYIATNELK